MNIEITSIAKFILLVSLAVNSTIGLAANGDAPPCEGRLYLDKSWEEVYEICVPAANRGDLTAKVLVAVATIAGEGRNSGKAESVVTLEQASLSGNDTANYWLGRLIYLGVFQKDDASNRKLALDYLGRVEGSYKASALTIAGQILAEGTGGVHVDMQAAKKKFIEAFATLFSRSVDYKEAKSKLLAEKEVLYPPLSREKYSLYVQGREIYFDSAELVGSIKKYGFNQKEIEQSAKKSK